MPQEKSGGVKGRHFWEVNGQKRGREAPKRRGEKKNRYGKEGTKFLDHGGPVVVGGKRGRRVGEPEDRERRKGRREGGEQGMSVKECVSEHFCQEKKQRK